MNGKVVRPALRDVYVAKVNAALEAGRDDLVDELSASYLDEALPELTPPRAA